jgi:hypothetical protein
MKPACSANVKPLTDGRMMDAAAGFPAQPELAAPLLKYDLEADKLTHTTDGASHSANKHRKSAQK